MEHDEDKDDVDELSHQHFNSDTEESDSHEFEGIL